MASRRQARGASSPLEGFFAGDRRDRSPGTHFAAEIGIVKPPRKPPERDAHVDEDLGCSAYGIDLPFLPRG